VWRSFNRTNSDDEERFCRKSNKKKVVNGKSHDLLNSRDSWLSPACSFASFRRSPFGATLPALKLARNVKCQKDDM
jgi:hypothetical protein